MTTPNHVRIIEVMHSEPQSYILLRPSNEWSSNDKENIAVILEMFGNEIIINGDDIEIRAGDGEGFRSMPSNKYIPWFELFIQEYGYETTISFVDGNLGVKVSVA